MSIRYCKLTRANIRTLAAGQKLTEHGISVERRRNGDLAYSINVMIDGERIHREIGKESEGFTRTQAEEVIETLRTQAREQRLNLLPAGSCTAPSPKPPKPTSSGWKPRAVRT